MSSLVFQTFAAISKITICKNRANFFLAYNLKMQESCQTVAKQFFTVLPNCVKL